MTDKELNNFIAVFQDAQDLSPLFSGLELIHQLNKYGDKLLLEIDENLIVLPSEKSTLYIGYVKKKILSLNFDNALNESTITTYLNQYGTSLEEINFPDVESSKLIELLSNYYKDYDWGVRDRAYVYQRDFVNYYMTLNVFKVLNYLENLSGNTFSSFNFNDAIFNSYEAFIWFNETLTEGNVLDSLNKAKKRGFQPIVNAIWKNFECKRLIFKHNLRLDDYISFLRNHYNANISSNKSLSDPTNYIDFVSQSISKFKAD